jgi:hypothetical protein
MGYKKEVFISYRRHREWTPWTRNHLRNLLDAYLTQDLGKPPRIFTDEHIEPGADWINRLGENLGKARVLLAVFSGDYFHSDWCMHELDLMHSRLLSCPGSNLIIPIIGHDGDMIPDEIAHIQPFDLSDYRVADLQRGTPLYQEFSLEVKKLSPHVADAIRSAPQFNPDWERECLERFGQVYQAHCGGPRAAVTTITPKSRPTVYSLPRVTPRPRVTT